MMRSLLRRRAFSTAATSFSELEQTMWQKSAATYADTFAKVTVQAADALLDGAGVPRTNAALVKNVMTVSPAGFKIHNEAAKPAPRAPMPEGLALPDTTPFKVLDVATGTGLIVEKAAERGATEVVGVDTAQAMIDLCAPVAAAYPGVASFSIGDAEKLPVDDNSFDSVVLGFVLLHLPSPAKALSEAFRVCKPGGKVSFSVWQTPEKGNLAFKMILDAIAKHGDPNVQLPGAPLPFFHFADEQNASTALAAAGFSASSVEVATIPCVAALESSADLFHMFKGATARTRALLEMQTAEQLKAIEEAMSIEVESAFTGANYGGVPRATSWLPAVPGADALLFDGRPTGRIYYQVPMPCVVASATKAAAVKKPPPAPEAPPKPASKPKASKKE